MTTHYNSGSRGRIEIASMNYHHASAARDKLRRECARIPDLAKLQAVRPEPALPAPETLA